MQNSEFIQLSRLRFFGIPLLSNNTAENVSSKKEKTALEMQKESEAQIYKQNENK